MGAEVVPADGKFIVAVERGEELVCQLPPVSFEAAVMVSQG